MLNLTEISIKMRKLFIGLSIAFVCYLILKLLIGFAVDYIKSTTPVKTLPPNLRFGTLPRPKFINIVNSSSGLNITLENVEGRPPEATTVAKIYSMPNKMLTLLSPERAKQLANKLGFIKEPTHLNPNTYFFSDNNQQKTLSVDITNLNFHMKYDYSLNMKDIFKNIQFESQEITVATINNYLLSNFLFDASLINNLAKVELLHYASESSQLVPVDKIYTADAIRIDYFRNKIDNLRILPPTFDKSYNYVLYTPSQLTNYLEISYTFWPVDYGDYATYPLISSEEAWKELLDGYGFVLNKGNINPNKIVVRKIYIAYYDSQEPQGFLQPIFVFEGDDGFVAYLPAIRPEFLE